MNIHEYQAKELLAKYLSLNKHDLVVFNQFLIHKTNNNKTNKIRFAATIRLKIYG